MDCNLRGNKLDCKVRTRLTCFACGLPICSTCSRRMEWFTYGLKRICDDCLAQEAKGKG